MTQAQLDRAEFAIRRDNGLHGEPQVVSPAARDVEHQGREAAGAIPARSGSVLRQTIGIDPGVSGALALLEDGWPVLLADMPTMTKASGKDAVAPNALRAILREWRRRAPGADCLVVLEQVNAMPSDDGGERRGMGAASAFGFGTSYGIAWGIAVGVGLKVQQVVPTVWKRSWGLLGKEKDAGRIECLSQWPAIADQLKRKRDTGRAEAALMASWGWRKHQIGQDKAVAP